MINQNPSNLITDKQAAKILGIKPSYLAYQRCMHRCTKLPYKKVGQHIYYRQEDVERFRDMRAEKKKHSRKKVVCPHD